MKNENNELKNKIEEQNKPILNTKEDAYYIDKSVIMKENEKNLIFSEIENKMNKKIIMIKKLYQATVDGGSPKTFHSKCDNIPNTLIIIKSQDLKRFGGFTPIPWKSSENGAYAEDNEKKTFIFSLNDKKIFPLNNIHKAVCHNKNCGPCFGSGWDIGIEGNPINENKLWVYKGSFDYNGYNSLLSECNYKNKGKALEYEVFQVIFN